MKKAKILAISSIFALLMCACNNSEASSSEDKGGFEYATPSITYDGVGEDEVDLKGNDILKNLIASFPAESATEKEKKDYNISLIENLNSNDVVAKGVTGQIVSYNVRDFGKLDVRNYDKKTTFSIQRDNEKRTLAGTFTYKETSNKEVEDEVSHEKTVVANEPINLTGKYEVGVVSSETSKKISKTTSFDNNARESIVEESGYNVFNLAKALQVYPLTDYKNAFLDKANEKPIVSEVYTYLASLTSTKDANGTVTIKIDNLLKNNPNPEDPKKELIERTDSFICQINADGVVLEAKHLHEDVWVNYKAKESDPISRKSIEKLEEIYTFTL